MENSNFATIKSPEKGICNVAFLYFLEEHFKTGLTLGEMNNRLLVTGTVCDMVNVLGRQN